MMSICNSINSIRGEHRQEWRATLDGSGYWVCLNSGCGEIQQSFDDHNGG